MGNVWCNTCHPREDGDPAHEVRSAQGELGSRLRENDEKA
ncbi:hypothetical protein COXBURSA331_A1612 [Coxiella burnetii RSA 331]|nr:hypothetical protein COXBURSA331_A1612 [Coxiella burnetii RSA 331]